MTPLKPSLVADAALRLGRISAAAERSDLRSLWVNHETARVVSSLFSRGASPLEPAELLALAANLPTGVPSLEEAAARRFWVQGTRLWRPRVSPRVEANVLEVTNQLAGLAREGIPHGDLALEAPVRMGAVTLYAVPAIALALPPESEAERFEEVFLEGIVRESRTAMERLEQLERDFERWRRKLEGVRSDSRLSDLLVLLGTLHALTPRYVAETLGVTRQAAARLLRKLEEAGIVRQAAQRQRWLNYIAENAAPTGLVPETTNPALEGGGVDVEAIENVLEKAYAALDRAARRGSGDQSP